MPLGMHPGGGACPAPGGRDWAISDAPRGRRRLPVPSTLRHDHLPCRLRRQADRGKPGWSDVAPALSRRRDKGLDLYGTIFEAIDMRSFSSLWYWIMLAVVWSLVGHRVLGVPVDMISAARRHGGQAEQDLEDMVRINVLRRLHFAAQGGIWALALGCFGMTVLLILGWGYGLELAQAIFLLGFPLGVVVVLSFLTARRIRTDDPQGEALHRHLMRHRFRVQTVGMGAIFITALWGMNANLTINVLGN